MTRTLLLIALIATSAAPVIPCDCRAPRPACAYVGADSIFLGRVSYTNDDDSGGWMQSTLVRFDVEEVFKGLPSGTTEVWVDPGSFTSCYKNYDLGKRYLIVAYRKGRLFTDSASLSVVQGEASDKPLPPGIDPERPPEIFFSPECSGSREADQFPNIDRDYAMLRAYRSGQPLPRVLGWVYLRPFIGWPVLNGPGLEGVQVTLSNWERTLRTTTQADGTFLLPEAPAGVYSVSASMPSFVPVEQQTILTIPEIGCGSNDVAMRTTSELRGLVVDHTGLPASGVPVELEVLPAEPGGYRATLSTESNAAGRFSLEGVPDTDVRLSYGSPYPSSNRIPYPLVYYPNAVSREDAVPLRVSVGQRMPGIELQLPPAPKVRTINVKVVRADGRSVGGVTVLAELSGRISEHAETGPSGSIELPCLTGLRYQLQAYIAAGSEFREGVFRSQEVPMVCGDDPGAYSLTLGNAEPW